MKRLGGFWRTKNGTLRSGWLLALGAVVTAGLMRAAQSIAALAAGALMIPVLVYGNSASVQNALIDIIRWVGCVAMGAGAMVSWHYFTKRPLSQMGLRVQKAALHRLFLGMLQGTGAALVVFGVLLAAGQVRVEVPAPAFHAVTVERILFYGLAALAEGIFYQGFCMHAVKAVEKNGIRVRWAVLLAAVLYTVGHIAADVPVWWHLNNLFLGGVFAAMTLATGDIWAAVGTHWMWNVVWGPVLGFAADGVRTQGLWQAQYTEATAWNGGPLGPQSGAAVFGVVLVWLIIWVTKVFLHRENMDE